MQADIRTGSKKSGEIKNLRRNQLPEDLLCGPDGARTRDLPNLVGTGILSRHKKTSEVKNPRGECCGLDGARTRDLLRDRQAF